MSGYFKWLDFSSAEREQTFSILASLEEKGTVDDLGIGAVRDAIADHHFPGISTIQTRAKYFLFLAWIFQSLEQSQVADERIEASLKEREIKLILALIGDPAVEKDRDGLIGKEAREKLKRFPSSVYWNGLRAFGICRFEGSLAEYLQAIPETRRLRRSSVRKLEASNEPEEEQGNWDGDLPGPPPDYLIGSNFALNVDQARYLSERARSLDSPAGDETLLSWCLRNIPSLDPHDFTHIWDLAAMPEMPRHLGDGLRHARHFSIAVQGAAAVYYVLLARKINHADVITRYESELMAWMRDMAEFSEELCAWFDNIDEFWTWVKLANPRVDRDVSFINTWCAVLRAVKFAPTQIEQVLTVKTTKLIKDREYSLKRALARLSNPPALKRWEANVGATPLSYRWGNATRFISDIRAGLTRREQGDA
jgi:hypothetical protein